MELKPLFTFNGYGPKQDSKSEYAAVIPRFIGRVLKGELL
jgi:hypothetical protein